MAVIYALLLMYGSLFPFSEWNKNVGGFGTLLTQSWPLKVSRSDLVTNLLVYIPLGFFLVMALSQRVNGKTKIIGATLCGFALSLMMEYLQSYLPARVPSLVDTLINTIGTLLGALAAHNLSRHTFAGGQLRRLREHLFISGPLANLGLAVMTLWILSQLMPLVPSLDRGTLVEGIRPILLTLRGVTEFNFTQAAIYALDITTLALIARTVLQKRHAFLRLFGLFICAVLLLKIPIISRQLSLEAVTGAGAALLILPFILHLKVRHLSFIAGALVLLAYVIEQLRRGDDATLHAMNWVPFLGQMGSVVGLADIMAALWPFAVFAYFVLLAQPRRRRTVAILGGVALFAFTLFLEWMQTRIPGRYADITDVCLAVLGWSLPWFVPLSHAQPPHAAIQIHAENENADVDTDTDDPVAAARSRRSLWIVASIAVSGLIIGTSITAWSLLSASPEKGLDEAHLPQLPAPEQLTPTKIAGFRSSHPRLPAPSDSDIARLRAENPQFLADAARRAQKGEGDFYASTLMAYAEPGSQDLARLHQRLMSLKFQWRGHEQTKPVAVAYDWLYHQWSEQQRAQLREQLVEGCNYQINFIRTERLSPYNVFLYNSPFQALMACAIALYGDDPRGDPVMTFTQDYWKNRVLPVWRQIMGERGGWHEGGEYVGIGIGQAVYQLPAMWRKATGEDVFASTPGIRGFLDFLVYRMRPDGTYFRWGDAGFFDRAVPDQLALALEYKHRAAYSLVPARKEPSPTSWPWGPLTDASLYDRRAIDNLPLTAHFDGLGLLVARSDWTPNATYVSFKAGDNYWSHSHLDQGAFTIYKGGALAIDSGLYGPEYGSDHHMNYTYQTIAHNTITVTDPEDTVPAPQRGDKPPRPIANDGGQRRIGSGWGVEPAPLDLAEWKSKSDIYHTGRIEKLLMKDGLSVAVADLTPAYTNSLSGRGTFSHRTRRVKNLQRVFGYDSVDDVVVIYDRVTATDAEFPKRWLLHSLEKPELKDDGFVVRTFPTKQSGHAGGRLEAHVLLPEKPYLQLMGGPGFSFFVDGKNYGEGVWEKAKKRRGAEPGAWRVELMAEESNATDEFLVVLLPTLKDQTPGHRIRRLKSPAGTGVEIVGPQRTTRWWFDLSKKNVRIETITPNGSRVHDLGPAQQVLGYNN